MSDKIIPLLDQNRPLLKTFRPSASFLHDQAGISQIEGLSEEKQQLAVRDEYVNQRINNFKADYTGTSWLSWNYRDWQTHLYLVGNKK